MITITVETDEEEAAIMAAFHNGALREAIGPQFTIRRGRQMIAGASVAETIVYTGAPSISGASLLKGSGSDGSSIATEG